MTDMQASVGLAQLDHLDGFIAARKRNFTALKAGLADLQDFAGEFLDPLGDAVAMHRSTGERAEHKEIERARKQLSGIGRRSHGPRCSHR